MSAVLKTDVNQNDGREKKIDGCRIASFSLVVEVSRSVLGQAEVDEG
jgi:hypothetical protein